MLDLIIHGGQAVTPTGVSQLSIGISDHKIVIVAAEITEPAKQTINAAGLHVFPGLIDVHVHFNDPGRSDWEGFGTGSAALAAGGGTMCFDMPLNASPPLLDPDSFHAKLGAATGKSYVDFALWGGLTPTNLEHMPSLAELGVVGFKAFMSNSGIDDFARADDLTLYRGMQIAARLKLPVAVHAESEELTSRLSAELIAAGKLGIGDYLSSRPIIAEVDAIRRAIAFARETGCSLHIVHISSAAGVAEVSAAKRAGGVDVTAETCPHYLELCDEDVHRLGAAAKCAPPLRTAEQRDSLWAELAAGNIDIVASDHSPAPSSMKQSENFFKVWGGIGGIQSTLPILLKHGLPMQTIAAVAARTPARRFGISGKGQISVGFDADLSLVDLNAETELHREQLLDRHKFSPYVGRRFRGVVRRTLLGGQTIFADGVVTGSPGGRFIKPRVGGL